MQDVVDSGRCLQYVAGQPVRGATWYLQVCVKIFKISMLMHGKPPSFATLIRWVQMA